MYENSLFGMGNPLLDITADAKVEFIKDFDLKVGDSCLANNKQKKIFEKIIEKGKVDYMAGGASLNTMRAFKWCLGEENCVNFFGCVGNDENAKTLISSCKKAGVIPHFLQDKTSPTGCCACLITDKERTLIADINAANNYKISHLLEKKNFKIIEKSKVFYISCFFLTVSVESMVEVGKHALKQNKTFMTNLSAPFLLQHFKDNFLKVLPYSDFIFGNEHEIKQLGEVMNYQNNNSNNNNNNNNNNNKNKSEIEQNKLKNYALQLSQESKLNLKKPRYVIITQGPKPIIVAKTIFNENGEIKSSEVFTHETPKLEKSKIIDSNGAGDSFCGGFISEFVKGNPIIDCLKKGIYCSQIVIQKQGCRFE